MTTRALRPARAHGFVIAAAVGAVALVTEGLARALAARVPELIVALPGLKPELALTVIGAIARLAEVAAAWWGVAGLVRLQVTTYAIGSRDIAAQGGVLRRWRVIVPLSAVRKISIHQGAVGRVLRYGDVCLHDGTDAPLVLFDLPRPDTHAAAIQDAMEHTRHAQ